MADKAINELVAATQVTPDSLFVCQQSNTAKKLEARILENWLVALADGHGGIQSIVKRSTSGLKDTYRITLADTTTFDFIVTNGRSITGVSKVSTSGLVDTHRIFYNDGTNSTFSVTNGRGVDTFEKISSVGLVDTYQITYNDGPPTTFTVTNGKKGDPGDIPQVWVRYASQEPTEASHDFGVLPDNWMGFCSNYDDSAPTDWQAYTWFKIKGEQGDVGAPATVMAYSVEYLASDSGTIVPSGSWTQSVPAIAQGRYLWTRITIQFNSGDPIVAYSVSRYGLDGAGSVSSVNQLLPGSDGNVQLTAQDVGATTKAYADGLRVRNLLDNSDFTNPVAQAGVGGKHGTISYAADRWILDRGSVSAAVGVGVTLNGTIRQKLEHPPAGTVSAFVGMASGTASITCANGAVTITSAGGVMKWAALYEGAYTEGTRPPYVPKGYAAELAECMRYYRRFANDNASIILSGHVTGSSKNAVVSLLISEPMRTAPTASFSGVITIRGITGYSTDAGSGDAEYRNPVMTAYCAHNHIMGLMITKQDGSAWGGLTNNTPITVNCARCTLELSADL